MAKLWHSRLIPTVITATDAQPGYPAANLDNFAVAREWRAVNTGAKEIILTIAAAQPALLFIHAANFSTCQVSWSTDGVNYSAPAALTLYANDMARYRGGLAINTAGVVKVKVAIASAATVDGRSYHAASSMTLWSTLVEQHASEWGYTPAWVAPQQESGLPNGDLATAATGIGHDQIALQWKVRAGESIATLLQKARQGVVIWTPDVASLPDQIWPVRWQDGRLPRTQENLAQMSRQATLREVVM